MKTNTQRWHSKRCFYTGEELMHYGRKCYQKKSYFLTAEHLLPKSKTRGITFNTYTPLSNYSPRKFSINKVPAAAVINRIVGDSPLKVKFALKEYLSKVNISSDLSIEIRMKKWSKLSKSFMRKYKINGIYPWDWNRHHFSKKDKSQYSKEELSIQREITRSYYINLLTLEEKQLFRFENIGK